MFRFKSTLVRASTRRNLASLRMVSNTSQLGGFFQFGNGVAGPVTRLDGALAFSETSDVLFFTRLYHGASTFPTFGLAGPQDATTSLVIANPNDEAITVALTLFGPIGQPIAQPVSQTLPRWGRLSQSLGTLFNISSPIADGYVRVDVEGPGAVGFALIEVQDTLLGFNASFGNEGNVLYSAQMASGGVMGNRVFTSLKVVNTSDDPRVVTITAFLDEHELTFGMRFKSDDDGLLFMVEEDAVESAETSEE